MFFKIWLFIKYDVRYFIYDIFVITKETLIENYKEYRHKRLLAKELNRMEFEKYTDPQTQFYVFVATILTTLIVFGILMWMFDASTKTSYEEYKYGYDAMEQILVKLD